MSKIITIDHVDKYYGDFQAIKDVSLQIKAGEFFTLLGPSGCGKTTLLRMIAGFNTIEKGEIRFDDAVINHVPTYRRNIGMVFQSYAIFPHLTRDPAQAEHHHHLCDPRPGGGAGGFRPHRRNEHGHCGTGRKAL